MKRDAPSGEIALVALGSNLPWRGREPSAILRGALGKLGEIGALEAVSRQWVTAAWPDPSDPPFVNLVVRLKTELGPVELLARLLEIERAFGRERGRANAPRTLDLDLIDYGGRVASLPATDGRPRLELPHPRAQERAFVLLPLAEVAPDWRHPITGTPIGELVGRLSPAQRAAARRATPDEIDG